MTTSEQKKFNKIFLGRLQDLDAQLNTMRFFSITEIEGFEKDLDFDGLNAYVDDVMKDRIRSRYKKRQAKKILRNIRTAKGRRKGRLFTEHGMITGKLMGLAGAKFMLDGIRRESFARKILPPQVLKEIPGDYVNTERR